MDPKLRERATSAVQELQRWRQESLVLRLALTGRLIITGDKLSEFGEDDQKILRMLETVAPELTTLGRMIFGNRLSLAAIKVSDRIVSLVGGKKPESKTALEAIRKWGQINNEFAANPQRHPVLPD